MNTHIIKPKNPLLKKYIQYFIFFSNDSKESVAYQTFPNSNLCLAIYKNNELNYENNNGLNHCHISEGKRTFSSRFYGFHKSPFHVNVLSVIDQICIVFEPAALRVFSQEPYENLLVSDDAFNIVFPTKDACFLEMLFAENNLLQRVGLLESFLLKVLKLEGIPLKMKEAIHLLNNRNVEISGVEDLSKKLNISEPTLFRLFTNHLGQSPKAYLKTIRFRNTLNEVLVKKDTYTNVAYVNRYFDQSHFIKDFKVFTGYSPKELLQNISISHDNLAWIYRK